MSTAVTPAVTQYQNFLSMLREEITNLKASNDGILKSAKAALTTGIEGSPINDNQAVKNAVAELGTIRRAAETQAAVLDTLQTSLDGLEAARAAADRQPVTSGPQAWGTTRPTLPADEPKPVVKPPEPSPTAPVKAWPGSNKAKS